MNDLKGRNQGPGRSRAVAVAATVACWWRRAAAHSGTSARSRLDFEINSELLTIAELCGFLLMALLWFGEEPRAKPSVCWLHGTIDSLASPRPYKSSHLRELKIRGFI